MDDRSTGLLIAAAGAVAVVVGLLFWAGALSWFGRLPGDIRYSSGGTRIYIPLMTMLLLSIVVSAISYVVRRFF